MSKGTQQGGDKVVEFINFSTLIVYKCPFKLCHCSQHHAYLITGRAGCGECASGRKHTARFKREWTALKNKVLAVTNKYSVIKLFLEFWKNEVNGADRLIVHAMAWLPPPRRLYFGHVGLSVCLITQTHVLLWIKDSSSGLFVFTANKLLQMEKDLVHISSNYLSLHVYYNADSTFLHIFYRWNSKFRVFCSLGRSVHSQKAS